MSILDAVTAGRAPMSNDLARRLGFAEAMSSLAPITSVSTADTAFVDVFDRGPIDVPVHVSNHTEFEQVFGGCSHLSEASYGVRSFFENGGHTTWIIPRSPRRRRARLVDGAPGCSVWRRSPPAGGATACASPSSMGRETISASPSARRSVRVPARSCGHSRSSTISSWPTGHAPRAGSSTACRRTSASWSPRVPPAGRRPAAGTSRGARIPPSTWRSAVAPTAHCRVPHRGRDQGRSALLGDEAEGSRLHAVDRAGPARG